MEHLQRALNKYATTCTKYEDVVTVCKQGANNYAEIFWSFDHDLKTCVYLINKGNVIIEDAHIFPKTIEFYIKAGAGAFLDYCPIWQGHQLAEPYLARRKAVAELLSMLHKDVPSIVFQYTSFDMHELPEEEMVKIENDYTEWMRPCRETPPDSPTDDDDYFHEQPCIIDRFD